MRLNPRYILNGKMSRYVQNMQMYISRDRILSNDKIRSLVIMI